MLRDAKDIDTHNYIVSQGKVCYKEMDGLSFSTSYSYLTSFAYMKEHENGRIL